jgi:hypothetical protein
MERILQIIFYAVGLPLEVLVICAMLRARAWRDVPVVFAYSAATLLASVIELGMNGARQFGAVDSRTFAYVYWIDEGVLQVLVFLSVISLIYGATAALQNRTLIRRALIASPVLFGAASIALHYDPRAVTGEWMTLVSRDISLCTAILDLALWTILLTFRSTDTRSLLLSGGLGIQFTGEAISHSFRSIAQLPLHLERAASTIVPLTNLIGLYVWWHAFRVSAAQRPLRLPTAENTTGEPQQRAVRP